MKIRYYFFLLALIIVGVFAALMWLTFSVRPVIFYVAEGVLVLMIGYLIFFYRKDKYRLKYQFWSQISCLPSTIPCWPLLSHF